MLRVGVVTPHVAAGPEVELPEMAAGRVAVTLARVESIDDAVDRAVARFGDGSVDVVVLASTSGGYELGPQAETELLERIAQAAGVPAVASSAAAVRALRACGVDRVALVHPPWFEDGLDELGLRYFGDQGFEVSVSTAHALPHDPARVQPGQLVDWVLDHITHNAGAVFMAGNGFRTAGAIDELERRTGRLVLGANQVLLWAVLAATGTTWQVTGYGRLFDR